VIEGRPSRTAARVALRRAAHQLVDTPSVLEDPLALAVIEPEHAARLRRDGHAFERSGLDSYLRAFMAVRSRFAEDELTAAARRGARQYVLLGAGLDTFAYRNPHAAVRVFEVDHPATQEWKRRRLREGGIPIPDSLTFVPVDFERQTLGDELARAGLDRGAPTLFAMLGVVPYLTPEALDGTWTYVASGAHGSGIVFDYSIPPASMSAAQRAVFDVMAARVAGAGEPWKTTLDPARLAVRLRSLGFVETEDLDGEAINARYFHERADGLRVGGATHLVSART